MFEMILGVYKPWEVSHFFMREISRGMHFKSCLGTPGARDITIFVKTYIFTKITVISVEDDLLLDYQRRRRSVCWWVISVEDYLFLGFQHRE